MKDNQISLFEDEATVRGHINRDKRKTKWLNGFQMWSNQQQEDESTYFGKCGYGSVCDWCKCISQKNPCRHALKEMCNENKIEIDYENISYEEVWNGIFGREE